MIGYEPVPQQNKVRIMRTAHRKRRRGFTLIELLTVIAIISLLIGVLVPAVSAAKTAAKKASTRGLIEALSKGCEMFQRDFQRYPRSTNMRNPFESSIVQLSGAQWLILELAGPDTKGYVAADQYRYPEVAGDPLTVDWQDWQKYYDASDPNAAGLHRFGPYAQLEGKVAQTPEYFKNNTSATHMLPAALTHGDSTAGNSDWSNGRLPFAVDAFGFPVLYYAANDQATLPFSDPADYGEGVIPGRYTQWDNAAFTGTDSGYGVTTGIDLGAGRSHPAGLTGWVATALNVVSTKSFAGLVYDQALFQQSQKVWPRRPDTFLFIAAGPDATYGTPDDVTNFEH
jgi:prepilin-type N-terminal cleavage/methylation domain-containing protein